MRFFYNIIMLGICSGFFRKTTPFLHSHVRDICKSSVVMRARKKASTEYNYDSQGKSRSKQMTPNYEPRSENQKNYVNFLNDENIPIVLGVGPAGCGKTMFACLQAIQDLRAGNINKIIFNSLYLSLYGY